MPRPSRRRIADGECDFRPSREIPSGDMRGLSDRATLTRDLIPARFPALTPGQKRRWLRDLAIAAGHAAGVSRRKLADIFDLPRSRVAEILEELPGKYRADGATPDAGAEAE